MRLPHAAGICSGSDESFHSSRDLFVERHTWATAAFPTGTAGHGAGGEVRGVRHAAPERGRPGHVPRPFLFDGPVGMPLVLSCGLLTLVLLLLHVVTGVSFARNACRRVFNREPPALSRLLPMLQVVRPLGMLWRLASAPLRCLPDVYVLGEVRCGTTTTAALLRDALGMAGPFTPWVHPLANEKESFFLVGHYWGWVPASAYRMCFPLRLVRWWYRDVLRRPFAVFEGCASYLSAPWAPALVRALTPRAVLVVCVREPVSQNLSWWRLEQSAMAWGRSLGLGEACWCGPPARSHYPPCSLRDALALSRSAAVEAQWRRAEALAPACDALPVRLPDWAIPFPNGQLSAFDRMGRFADTIERWLHFFGRDQLVFVHLEELSRDPTAVLERIAAKCRERGLPHIRVAAAAERPSPTSGAFGGGAPTLNEAAALVPELEPDESTMRELAAYYRPHNERLFALLGRDLGWHSKYWYYR